MAAQTGKEPRIPPLRSVVADPLATTWLHLLSLAICAG
jgi:hypothetical protein